MSAAEDYPTLAFRAGLVHRERPSPALYSERTELVKAFEEIDWLRNSVGELLARLATVAGPDDWQRPV